MNVLSGVARRVALIVFATLALALSACSSAPSTPAGPALDFVGTTVDGGRFDAATLSGTPAVLWFWAPF